MNAMKTYRRHQAELAEERWKKDREAEKLRVEQMSEQERTEYEKQKRKEHERVIRILTQPGSILSALGGKYY